MKRRGLIFCGLLLIALAIVYLQPVFFPRAPKISSEKPAPSVDVGNTSLNYEPIKTQGYASYIDQPISRLEKSLGKPIKSYASGYGYMINVYVSIGRQQYLEANISAGKVKAIKVIGQQAQNLEPFQMKMTMNQLAEITMVFPSFSLDYQGEQITFELMEEDMNYRPLIAFDNGTFAILFFNQKNSELMGVMFLDQETLLHLSPYQVIEGETPYFKESAVDWQTINQTQDEQAYSILNILREQEDLPKYRMTFTLQGISTDLVLDVTNDPKKYFSPEYLADYQAVMKNQTKDPFVVVATPFSELLKKQKAPALDGFMEVPCYDVMFNLLSVVSDPYLHTKFLNERPQAIGIAINKKSMVILIEEQAETKDSE